MKDPLTIDIEILDLLTFFVPYFDEEHLIWIVEFLISNPNSNINNSDSTILTKIISLFEKTTNKIQWSKLEFSLNENFDDAEYKFCVYLSLYHVIKEEEYNFYISFIIKFIESYIEEFNDFKKLSVYFIKAKLTELQTILIFQNIEFKQNRILYPLQIYLITQMNHLNEQVLFRFLELLPVYSNKLPKLGSEPIPFIDFITNLKKDDTQILIELIEHKLDFNQSPMYSIYYVLGLLIKNYKHSETNNFLNKIFSFDLCATNLQVFLHVIIDYKINLDGELLLNIVNRLIDLLMIKQGLIPYTIEFFMYIYYCLDNDLIEKLLPTFLKPGLERNEREKIWLLISKIFKKLTKNQVIFIFENALKPFNEDLQSVKSFSTVFRRIISVLDEQQIKIFLSENKRRFKNHVIFESLLYLLDSKKCSLHDLKTIEMESSLELKLLQQHSVVMNLL